MVGDADFTDQSYCFLVKVSIYECFTGNLIERTVRSVCEPNFKQFQQQLAVIRAAISVYIQTECDVPAYIEEDITPLTSLH